MDDAHSGPLPPVSKYIGETEPELRPLAHADEPAAGPALTLAESEALFGARGEPVGGAETAGSAASATNSGCAGIYRGVCVNPVDPLLQSRLQVNVPAVSGASGGWAQACLPPGWSGQLPAVGHGIWVMFEGGDASYPVWLGAREG